MANRRLIYQDFFEDDYFGTVEIGMRLFWLGLITAASDDQGRILDNSSLIRAKVFMYDGDVTDDQINKWLGKLYLDGKIIRYVVNNKHLIQIAKWWDYQKPSWASESKYLAPPNWIDRVRCHVTGKKIKLLNWDMDGGIPKQLPSYLPSGINEVKDKGKEEVKGKDEFEGNPQKPVTLFDACQLIFERKKGLPITDGASFALMIKNFESHSVIPEDYAGAIDAMSKDPKYKRANKPTSFEAWAIGIADKRLHPTKFTKGKRKSIDTNQDPDSYRESWLGKDKK